MRPLETLRAGWPHLLARLRNVLPGCLLPAVSGLEADSVLSRPAPAQGPSTGHAAHQA